MNGITENIKRDLQQFRVDTDEKVIELSEKIVNALPGSDLTWAEEDKATVRIPVSRDLLSQIDAESLRPQIVEKQKKHLLLIQFLQDMLLFETLSPATKATLAEHGEKLEVAFQLSGSMNCSWTTLTYTSGAD